MSLNINGNGLNSRLGGSINTNSKQYKAAMEMFGKEAEMEDQFLSEDQKLIQQVFGLKEQRVKTWMKWFDSDGNYIGGGGDLVAGMSVTGIPESERHQIISVSEEARQKMYDETLRHFKQENGVANGDTTRRSEVFREYQLSVPVKDRLKGTWTLEQYERAYAQAFYDACKSADLNWKAGKQIPNGALESLSREAIDSTLVKNGNTLERRDVDITV
ncbi:MAG: DUF3879 family protein [Candidatus Weimeria sp.]